MHQEKQDDSQMTASIVIERLTKEFSGKRALDSVSLRIYKGQIIGLLGHNGAGKSTLINILCGLLGQDSGSVEVLGLDSRYDMEAIRQQIGVCLQEDILFQDMTVYEHLDLVMRINRKQWN